MYNVSSNSTIQQWYKDAIYNPNRRLKLEFYVNDTLIDNAYILDKIELEYDTMQDGYTVGNVIYSKLSFSLYSSITIFEMANITIKIGVEIFNTSTNKYEYITVPFGQYKVVDIESTKLRHKITAYDKCYNQLQMPFVKTKNQYTSGELLAQITSETGIQFKNFPTNVVLANEDIVTKTQDIDGNEVEERKPGTNFDNHTYASILGLVAGVCGGNIIFSREGKCKLVVGLPQSDVAVLSQDFTEPTIKPFTYDKKRLEIAKREDLQPIKVGTEVVTANQTLAISNPLFTTNSANRVLDVIDDISYQPISTKIMTMPLHLEPLDVISIVYEDVTYKLPLQKFKMTFIGSGLIGEMESFVSNQTQGGYQGSLTTQVNNLSSQVANMNKLVVGSLVVGDLEALSIKVDELTANVAKVNQLIANGITADQIQSYNLTSKNTTIENGLIKDAMIMNVSADKILAGQIDTGAITIGSKDGKMIIADETIQISDGSHVRVQIGQTANGDYALVIYDKNGGVMFDATGITEKAIKSAIIRDNMISPQANINAKKLNIQSLFTQMNKDGSNTLKASKIFLDTEQQTLNIAFNTMTEKQELLTEITDTHTTQLNTQQGQIDTLIKNTTIEDDGQTTTLKDAFSQFVQTQDGFNLKVEEHESKFENLQVGGTNLIINSDFFMGKRTNWTYAGSWTIHPTEKYKDKYIIHSSRTGLTSDSWAELFSNKIVTKEGETFTMSVDIKWQDIPSGESSGITIWGYDSNKNRKTLKEKRIKGSQDWNRLALTCTIPNGVEHIRGCITHRRNGGIYATNFKLERGNVPTDWSPAPQDTEEGLSVLETRVQTAESKITKDAIINTVSGTYVTQTDFNTAINQPIGVTNRIPNSAPTSTSGWNHHTSGWSRSLVDCSTSPSGKAMRASLGKTLSTGGMYKTSTTTLATWEHGEQYTMSCWMRASNDAVIGLGHDAFTSTNGSNKNVTTEWQHFTTTGIYNQNASHKACTFYIKSSQPAGFWFEVHSLKVEKGNKATDWSPAPEDTQNSISSLETRINTAEQKITEDAIISTVSSTFVKQTDFDNMTIGGENLIPNSNFDYGFTKWNGNTSIYYLTEDNVLAYNQAGITNPQNYKIYTDAIDVSDYANKELTLTFEYNIPDTSLNTTPIIGCIMFFEDDTSTKLSQAVSFKYISYDNTYVSGTRAKHTSVIVPSEEEKFVRIYALMSQNGKAYWTNFQLEVGNTPTAWKPSSKDAILHTDQTTSQISSELGDLSQLVTLNNGSDSLTPQLKVKLVSEYSDAKSVYDNLSVMYTNVGITDFENLVKDMNDAHSSLSGAILDIQDTITEYSETGLSAILEKFNVFYQTADALNQAIINGLKGVTDTLSTEIQQLSDSVNIQISSFNSQLGELTTRFIFDVNGLTIKSSANATKYIKLDNDSLDFIDNGNMVAQISDQQLNITSAQINNDLKIGNMKIKPSGIGGVIFVFE